MVLESLVGPKKAERNKMWLFIYGLVYAVIGAFVSLWVFKSQASMVMVFLTVLAAFPLFYKTLRYEEKKDLNKNLPERVLIKEHGKALAFLMYLFLGFVVAYTIIFLVLPESTTSNLFSAQVTTINSINSNITGNASIGEVFFKILSNNLRVLFFCIFFAFFYGAGALFILAWNASVIGAAAGSFVNNRVSEFGSYFIAVPISLLRYMTHGVFEIAAYFVAGLAGGIISVAVINHKTTSEQFKHIVIDSLDLILLAVGTLVFAALVEVYFTPLFF
ncbi:stage II sporulation protein M [Candidatus Woesearchaeota archaeon]|nr:stage II sporulation protein M [Candidatus Woesearchaeota archaeon]